MPFRTKFQAINTNDLTLSPNLLILKYKSFNVKCKSFDSRYKSFGVKPFVQKNFDSNSFFRKLRNKLVHKKKFKIINFDGL